MISNKKETRSALPTTALKIPGGKAVEDEEIKTRIGTQKAEVR